MTLDAGSDAAGAAAIPPAVPPAVLPGVQDYAAHLLKVLPAAVYVCDADGLIVAYNDRAAELWGQRPEPGDPAMRFCASHRLYWPDGRHLPHEQTPMRDALVSGTTTKDGEVVFERHDGSRFLALVNVVPLRDGQGRIIGAANCFQDITERRRAERQAQQLAAIVESSDDAIVSKTLDGVIATWNRGAERLFGYTADETIGKPITILFPPDRHDEEPEILARIQRGERVDHYETVRRHKDGSLIDISLTVSPIKGTDGRIVGASKIARDITERKRADSRLRLLAREVDHRAKNLLAVILSMVRFTRADTVPEFAAAIDGRIRALAHAHSMLSESHWQGADLERLAEEVLAPHRRPGARPVRIDGPGLKLAPSAAQSVAMVLHELATNAAKYGAFSAPSGHVHLEWSLPAGGRLVLLWTETGGPPVRQPSRRGFGTGAVERVVRGQLGGQLSLDWRAEGLVCEIDVPLDAIVDPAG
ncbi:PAS domain S-box protein [Arenibaculum sp.]|jgi:PAS domain S-box-containing protein|uniref:PAS domain S-box protein n=1 Tax=Arenibaculum sp. TaxID=2865862 RepID=UPI002E1156B7|nr:PAS domain S-box protein [Arenibaculum sp.]